MPYLLQPPVAVDVAADPEALAIGDVTGDGIADLVVVTTNSVSSSNADADMLIVYPGGLGGFGTRQTYPLGFDPFRPSVAIADMNEDGKSDVVVGSSSGMSVYLGGSGSLGTGVLYDDLDQFHLEDNGDIEIADVDGDGHLDVIGVPWNFDIMVYYGNGDGGFRDVDVLETEAHGHTVATMGDIDNDNDGDLLIMTGLTEHAFAVHTDVGGSLDTTALFWDLPESDFAGGIGTGDLTGDGKTDAVVADGLTRNLYVFPQITGTLSTSPTAFPVDPYGYVSVGSPGVMAVGDLDGDGDKDLIVTLDPSDWIGLYFTGPGGIESEFIVPWIGGLGHGPQGIAIGDLDGDDCIDVVTGEWTNGLIVGYGNCGGGTFDPCPGSDSDEDGVGDTCDCAPTDPLLPNEAGACPVGPPPPGGPAPTSCDAAGAGGAGRFALGLALALALGTRRRTLPSSASGRRLA